MFDATWQTLHAEVNTLYSKSVFKLVHLSNKPFPVTLTCVGAVIMKYPDFSSLEPSYYPARTGDIKRVLH